MTITHRNWKIFRHEKKEVILRAFLMKELCHEFLQHTGIKRFSYLHFDRNANVIELSTDTKWVERRFINEIRYRIMFESQLNKNQIGIPTLHIWSHDLNNPLMRLFYENDIWNGCNVYIPENSSIDVFSFSASRSDTNMINFYIQNVSSLHAFILYFKKAAAHFKLLDDRNDCKIITDLTFPKYHDTLDNLKELKSKLNANIIGFQGISIGAFSSLSLRELEICAYLQKGYSNTRIANLLQLSNKTIESHLTNIKNKTGFISRDSIIDEISSCKWIFNSMFDI